MNNKGYIITIKGTVVKGDLLLKLLSSKHYIPSLKLPLIIYKDQNQIEEIETGVRPAFRMHGFLILNLNENDRDICNRVKKLLNSDDFIRSSIKKDEIIEEEEIAFNKIEDLIKKTNEILGSKGLNIAKDDILKISEIKVTPRILKAEKISHETPSVRIFVFSLGDVSGEWGKAKDIINEIKRQGLFSQKLHIYCETFNWEDSSDKEKFDSLKDVINQLTSEYNIYVVILWEGFLEKTDDVNSEIKKELRELLKDYENKRPQKFLLMFYSRDNTIIEMPQSEKKQFDEFQSVAQEKNIITNYKDEKDFEHKFREYILSVLRQIEFPSDSPILELPGNKTSESGWRQNFIAKYKKTAEQDIQKCKESETFKSYIRLKASGSNDNLVKVVDNAVDAGKSAVVIGEFGSGKTTFARRYEYLKKCDWLANPDESRLVLFLNMNEYSRTMKEYSKRKHAISMTKWILSQIKHEIDFSIKAREFFDYLNEKKIILIFDGLDEVANIPGEDAINKSIRKINRITHKGSPVIITSRKAFLESEVDPRNLKDYDRIHIDELRDDQIYDFVTEKITGNRRDFLKKKDEIDSKIEGLSHRPLFLSMMIEIYQRGHLTNIENRADLYKVLTDDWINKEIEKEVTTLKKEEMKQIIQELAFKMFIDNLFLYNKEEFNKIVNGIIDKLKKTIKLNSDRKSVLADISNTSFLVRNKVEKAEKDKKKNFGFPHRSFVEYFAAQKLASEIMERNTENFSIRILYEEIFEFLALIMTKENGKDKYLGYILGSPQFPFKARVNAIPPLRKQKNKIAIEPLLDAHTDIESRDALLKFVCGYTLAIFQEKYPEKFDSKKDKLDKAYKTEKNALIRLRTALLLTGGEYNNYEELNTDYEFSSADLDEILTSQGTIEAYDKILKVNREHPVVLEESIRILTLYVTLNSKSKNFKRTLLRYIFAFGHNHESERMRRISLWSIDKLGLLEPKDRKNESKKIKTKAARIVTRGLLKETHSSVNEIAKTIVAKYPIIFIAPHLRGDQSFQ